MPLYEQYYGMKLIDKYDFSDHSIYFLARPRDADTVESKPGSKEAHEHLFSLPYNYVELHHKHGVEKDANLAYDSGNNEPKRGFGHIAFLTPDVPAAVAKLDEHGSKFKKRPEEGRMKGLAFAYDADGYWIEIIKRSPNAPYLEEFNLAQTMLRIKDPKKSLEFYQDVFGMTLVTARHFDDFSLYFLMSVPEGSPPIPDSSDPDAQYDWMKSAFLPVLELTHNHGTENDANFRYHNGNSDPLGFMSLGFTTDSFEQTTEALKSKGVEFLSGDLAHELGAAEGSVAVVSDPDGYAVRLIAKGAILKE